MLKCIYIYIYVCFRECFWCDRRERKSLYTLHMKIWTEKWARKRDRNHIHLNECIDLPDRVSSRVGLMEYFKKIDQKQRQRLWVRSIGRLKMSRLVGRSRVNESTVSKRKALCDRSVIYCDYNFLQTHRLYNYTHIQSNKDYQHKFFTQHVYRKRNSHTEIWSQTLWCIVQILRSSHTYGLCVYVFSLVFGCKTAIVTSYVCL